LSTSADIK